MHSRLLQEDEKIIALIMKNDPLGIELLYEQYGEALYGIIFRIVKQTAEADRVLSATFVKIYQDIDQYRPERLSLFTWIMHISRSLAKGCPVLHQPVSGGLVHDDDIFDLMFNQGLSLQCTANLLQKSEAECTLLLRSALKKTTSIIS